MADFGAAMDGTTDDTVAVTRALLAGAATGLEVVFPAGRVCLLATWTEFSTTAALRIRATGCTLRGPASGTVGFLNAGGPALSLEGGTFERWGSVQRRALAQSGGIEELRITGCTFKNISGNTIDIERPLRDFWITDNKFSAVANYAIRVGENTFSNQDTRQKGTIAGNKFDGITAAGSTSCAAIIAYGREIDITGNAITNLQSANGEGWGIYTKVRYGQVSGNTIRNVKSTTSVDVIGVNIKGATRAVVSSPQGFAMRVFGNTIENVGVVGTAGGGIRLQGEDHNCFGNTMENTGLSGVGVDELSAYSNIRVSDNTVRFSTLTAGTSGVRVEGSGTGVTVEGNTTINASIGVRVQANANLSDVAVRSNVLRGCTWPVFFDAQAGSTLTRLRVESNVADGAAGGAALLNNGSTGTHVGMSVVDNDFERCGNLLSGALPAGTYVRATTRVSTTGNTPTTLFGADIADTSAFATEVRVTAQRDTGGDRALYHLEALHFRASGSTAQQGSTGNLATIESDAGWNAAFAVVSPSVLLQVTGVPATTIAWRAQVEMVPA
ncbi:MAG: hypothetical protein ACRC1H_01925 [Caldilineaceae bacterium]